MRTVTRAAVSISILFFTVLVWASPAGAQTMVPFKVYITGLTQLDEDVDPFLGIIGDYYARVTINGVAQDNKQGGDGACNDETTGFIGLPFPLFKNFRRIPQCQVRTPWVFSRLVPAGEPVHVRLQIFDADLFFDDEADLKAGDGNAIDFDVDPATGKWGGDVDWPQNCSRPDLALGKNNVDVCWQASFDTDDDGLLDVWERFGVDLDNDGVIDLDLPALGANPLRKDVFVEADYLQSSQHSHGPRKDAIDRVVAAFAGAPVSNPDGTRGVQLHVDVGPLYGAGATFPVDGPGGVTGTYGDFGGGNAIPELGNEIIDAFHAGSGLDAVTSFEDLEAANFDPNRELVFRYAIFGHQTDVRLAANDCTSGAVNPAERDMLVTLGGVDPFDQPCFGTEAGFSVGSSAEQAGTFMHDLGHLLGLFSHSGTGDGIDDKPNYLSVMNLSFETCGVPASPGLLPGGCDYSRSVARTLPPPLDERSLDECLGIAGLLGFGPIDWNQDDVLEGETRCGPVPFNTQADVNGDGICVRSGPNGVINSIPEGDDRISNGFIIDGPDRVCSTTVTDGTDDVQVTANGDTPSQPDVLNSFDDWKSVVFDLFNASAATPTMPEEADASVLRAARLALASMTAPRIVVDQRGPATAQPGDLVTYTVTVTNRGRGPAISPILEETNPDGGVATSDLGIVIVGSESRQFRSFRVPTDACPGEFSGARAHLTFKDFPGQDLSAAATTPLEILDVAAPTVELTLSPAILWPPDHKLVDVTATITVTDNCDQAPAVTLVSITSNEPESGFIGNGDEGPDVAGAAFGTDDRTFSLRGERATGTGSTGRTYTVTYRVTDRSGNATLRSATVTVPTSNDGK